MPYPDFTPEELAQQEQQRKIDKIDHDQYCARTRKARVNELFAVLAVIKKQAQSDEEAYAVLQAYCCKYSSPVVKG